MNVIHRGVFGGVICQLVEEDGCYFVKVNDEITEKIDFPGDGALSCEPFMLDCILESNYNEYITRKELEGIEFD